VLDTIDEFDGLERLIVIAIGLDSRIDDSTATLDTRSRLYRAITRAHMMVLVVNETVRGGWLDFLEKVDFEDTFDAEVERQRASNEATRIVARNPEIRKQIESAAAANGVHLGEEVRAAMQTLVVKSVEGGTSVVVESETRQHVQRYAEQLEAIKMALDDLGFSGAQIGKQAADQMAADVALSALRGAAVSDAVQQAAEESKRRKQEAEDAERSARARKQLHDRIALGSELNSHIVEKLESIAFVNVSAGTGVEAAAVEVLQLWFETKVLVASLLKEEARKQKVPADDVMGLRDELTLAVLQQADHQSAEKTVQAAVRAERDVQRQQQIWAALEARGSLERKAKDVIARDVGAAVTSGSVPIDAAIDEALVLWKRINEVLESGAAKQGLSFEDGKKVALAARVLKVRARAGWVLQDVVREELEKLGRLNQLQLSAQSGQSEVLKQPKQPKQPKQSVWDTSVTFDDSSALESSTFMPVAFTEQVAQTDPAPCEDPEKSLPSTQRLPSPQGDYQPKPRTPGGPWTVRIAAASDSPLRPVILRRRLTGGRFPFPGVPYGARSPRAKAEATAVSTNSARVTL